MRWPDLAGCAQPMAWETLALVIEAFDGSQHIADQGHEMRRLVHGFSDGFGPIRAACLPSLDRTRRALLILVDVLVQHLGCTAPATQFASSGKTAA